MAFDPSQYNPSVSQILALDGHGQRLMPLASGTCSSPEALRLLQTASASQLFPNARAPEAALSGLYLYFSCLDESHTLSQAIHTRDGSFWHGIMHRQEPDPGNASYWFHKVGDHPVFPALAEAARQLAAASPEASFKTKTHWDPFAFIDFAEQARRRPNSPGEALALRIQRAEWQILFHHCASPSR
ncbi:MAG: hypothetical protein JNK48_07125 [Bryobacterales bacterium]|nr:hypothetical protein [Bryobacterales bacterium]